MPDRAELATSLRAIVVDVLELDINPVQIHEDTNLFDLGIDSLAVMRMLGAVQDCFSIELPDEALNASMFERFGSLVDTIAAAA